MVPLIVLVMSSLITFTKASGVSTSLAIIPQFDDSTTLVCAIVLINTTRSIECTTLFIGSAEEPFPVYPANISFASITGGGNSLCGLQYDGTALFCWRQTADSINSTSFVSRRVYKNDTVPLRELAVGVSHIAATDASGSFIRWWSPSRNFPTEQAGNFSSLTSGNDFVCAIDSSNDAVDCWGPRGPSIKAAFADERMAAIVAGDFRACGVTKKGKLLCSGKSNDFEQPSFEFRSLALGSNDTCVLHSNGTVVCWGAGGESSPAENSSFLSIVASGDLFCGLTFDRYTVYCWWTNRSPSRSVQLRLQMVAPGICTSKSSCRCGFLSGSQNYCSDNFVTCRPCSYPSHRPSLWSRERKGWIVFGCVAFVGVLMGCCCIWKREPEPIEVVSE